MLRLHNRAKDEIHEAAAWYEDQSPGLGRRFIASVRELLEHLEASPQQFARLKTLDTDTLTRRALVGDFPYLLIF